jgi:thymidine kinase
METEKRYDVVFLDEVQFFMEPYFHGDIIQIVHNWLLLGTNVVVAGIDMDWRGQPFEITAKLLAMSDQVSKLTAICSVCGHDATKTYKKSKMGGAVELGATDLYEARCNEHFD